MVSKTQSPISRYEIWLINLDPTIGSEVRKTRPCVVVSPNDMNKWIKTVIIAPMTSANKSYVSRVPIKFEGKLGQIMLDQIRTVDKARLVKCLGAVETKTATQLSNSLVEMFKS